MLKIFNPSNMQLAANFVTRAPVCNSLPSQHRQLGFLLELRVRVERYHTWLKAHFGIMHTNWRQILV